VQRILNIQEDNDSCKTSQSTQRNLSTHYVGYSELKISLRANNDNLLRVDAENACKNVQ